jgi:6-phosphogluconolactonase
VSDSQVVVHADADILARAVAARLVTHLVDAQAARGVASVVVTGGGVGTAVLREVRDSPARDAVDWTRVDVWWGDERWVPAADPQRNELQAREALLDAVPLDPARVHAFPAADGPHAGDPVAAAAAYAATLAAAGDGGLPRFDVLMLGMGEEGHVASIFPESPAASDERTVAAVFGCPKPPPTRLTLTFPVIRSATEVWIVAAGAGKAGPAARALGGASPLQVPAAGARGRTATRYLLDRAAAAGLR